VTGRRSLARGDVVLVRFPFTDLSGSKLRPALIVGRPAGDDFIVAFITTRVATRDPRSAHLLQPSDMEFRTTGLKVPSVIRLERLATLQRSLIQRRLGSIGQRTEQVVARCLRYVFEL
jgi:mRNA interferase MazF